MIRNICCRAVLLAAGIFLLGDGIFLLTASNVNAGMILVLMWGILLTGYGIWFNKINEKKGIVRVCRYVILTVLILQLGLASFLFGVGTREGAANNEDAILVLGAAVHGTRVSRPLGHRLNKAIECAQKNPEAVIVVSGGKGMQEKVSEAYAMEQYLIRKGIPKSRIIKEEQAASTFENFRYAGELLEKRFGKNYTCVYVTNAFHLYRAGKIAEKVGIEAIGAGADIDWYTVPSVYLRETLAVVKFWVFRS